MRQQVEENGQMVSQQPQQVIVQMPQMAMALQVASQVLAPAPIVVQECFRMIDDKHNWARVTETVTIWVD